MEITHALMEDKTPRIYPATQAVGPRIDHLQTLGPLSDLVCRHSKSTSFGLSGADLLNEGLVVSR